MNDQSPSDHSQQMEACRELAPETMLYHLNQPWKALELVLRTRNFENKRLIDRIMILENFVLAQHTMLQECRQVLEEEFSSECEYLPEIDGLHERAEQLLGQEL